MITVNKLLLIKRGIQMKSKENTSTANITNISRFLCYLLRHKPEAIGLNIEYDGAWAYVDELIDKVNEKTEYNLDRELLKEIVETDAKGRYSFSEDNKKIRCNQGHSFPVALNMKVCTPPKNLFHGTAINRLESIKSQGIKSMSRNFVHLSADIDTAIDVGKRHGKPVVLVIDVEQMVADGNKFMISDNGVWQFNGIIPWKYVTNVINVDSNK